MLMKMRLRDALPFVAGWILQTCEGYVAQQVPLGDHGRCARTTVAILYVSVRVHQQC